jgi:hypothetical protein
LNYWIGASEHRTILYQLSTGVATDISGMRTLPSTLKGIVPILKRPLLDLADLNLPLQNLQGLTLGPRLADGSRSLLLIGDNGMNSGVPTQLVMLRLGNGRSSSAENFTAPNTQDKQAS